MIMRLEGGRLQKRRDKSMSKKIFPKTNRDRRFVSNVLVLTTLEIPRISGISPNLPKSLKMEMISSSPLWWANELGI